MQDNNQYFIIDFDSTFIKKESLEEMAKVGLNGNPDKEELLYQISEITKQSMEGKLDYGKSLSRRFALFAANKTHIDKTIEILKNEITDSILRNKDFFTQYKDQVYIVSGGFKQIIWPIVKEFGIAESHVYANCLTFDSEGNITGMDPTNPAAFTKGKAEIIKGLGLKGDLYLVGDGYNDYRVKEAMPEVCFYLFTENIKRKEVIPLADKVISSFDEFLFDLNLPRFFSYPKSKMKALFLEKIHHDAVTHFIKQGYDVEEIDHALPEEDLCEKIKNISILGIRSQTKITKKIIDNAAQLMTIGTFCIGTNQIDVKSASEKGIAVFNAPYSNTRSVVELTIGNIIMLMRQISIKNQEMHQGIWNKSASNCYEVRGKKLGIIGYGKIGSQLSVLAESIGMDVYFYNHVEKLVLGNAKPCHSIDELLKKVDVVSVHIDGRLENTNFMNKERINLMKKGSYLINLSRGNIVDIDALTEALNSGHLAGAALDVYPEEPKSNTNNFQINLQNIPNVILTPHIGGSTEEAQLSIGKFVADKLTKFVDTGETTLSVNFPEIKLPELKNAYRLIHVHRNVPGIMAQINNIFAEEEINIEGQYLKTNGEIGYVITDINRKGSENAIERLKQIKETIRVRILY